IGHAAVVLQFGQNLAVDLVKSVGGHLASPGFARNLSVGPGVRNIISDSRKILAGRFREASSLGPDRRNPMPGRGAASLSLALSSAPKPDYIAPVTARGIGHGRDAAHEGSDHRLRPGGLHGRGLFGARDAGPAPRTGHPAGRPAYHHHRGGELARRYRGAGPRPHGADGGTRPRHGGGGDLRPYLRTRSLAAALHGRRRFRHD